MLGEYLLKLDTGVLVTITGCPEGFTGVTKVDEVLIGLLLLVWKPPVNTIKKKETYLNRNLFTMC